MPTKKFEDIYWLAFGAWKDNLTEFIYNMYKQYKYRELPLNEILEIIKQGVPATLCRLHIERKNENDKTNLSIADHYKFPPGYFASSIQFIPTPDQVGSTEGYIACTIVHSDSFLSYKNGKYNSSKGWSENSEIWIFDAKDIAQGPRYRLSHPKLNFGFTIHTTWLKEISPYPVSEYDVREDFDWLVSKAINEHSEEMGNQIHQLFQEAYKEFEQDRKAV